MTSNLTWVKSSYSGSQGGNCVEAAADNRGGVLVRDTKDRDVAVLTIPAALWRRFAADVKDGSIPRLSASNRVASSTGGVGKRPRFRARGAPGGGHSSSSSSSGGVGLERTLLSRGTAANGTVANGGAPSSITSPDTVGTRPGPGYPLSTPLSQ